MKLKLTEKEVYEVIIQGDIVLALTDEGVDLTFKGHTGAVYESEEQMMYLGLEHLIGIKRVYLFSYDVVKGSLID